MTFNCYRCGHALNEPGALVFSPPRKPWSRGLVVKYHLCRYCWKALQSWMIQRAA